MHWPLIRTVLFQKRKNILYKASEMRDGSLDESSFAKCCVNELLQGYAILD